MANGILGYIMDVFKMSPIALNCGPFPKWLGLSVAVKAGMDKA
ncbi:MAG: hypothetical protein ABJM43_01310 [Paracoccaceae bacterium]